MHFEYFGEQWFHAHARVLARNTTMPELLLHQVLNGMFIIFIVLRLEERCVFAHASVAYADWRLLVGVPERVFNICVREADRPHILAPVQTEVDAMCCLISNSFLEARVPFSVAGGGGSSESYVMFSVPLDAQEMVFRTVCAAHGLEIADLRPVSAVRSSNQTSLVLLPVLVLFPKTKSSAVNMDRMELKKVSTEADDESSVDDSFTPMDSEKATINSQLLDEDDAESQKFLTNGMMKKKKYEEYDEEYHPGHASFGMSVFNLSNAIMGSGILGLSFAMANTGIILFPKWYFQKPPERFLSKNVLANALSGRQDFSGLRWASGSCQTVISVWEPQEAVAILSLYSVHLLLVTAKEGGSLIYERLGERAFGWPGKMAAFGSITLQNIGAMSSYLFIVKYELPEVIRAFLGLEENSGEWYLNGNYVVVLVSVGIILPLSLLKNLGYLGYTSGFSLSCMVFFLGVLIYKKTILPCPLPFFYQHESNMSMNGSDALGLYVLQNASALAYVSEANGPHLDAHAPAHDSLHSAVQFTPRPEDHEDMCTPKYFVFNSQTAYTIPILAFAFVCHPEVLPIYSELKDRSRKKMQNVSNLSILAMLVMYLLSALFGYLTFYDHVEAELLHTFTKVYKFDTMLLLVRLAVLTAVTLTVPIVLFPVSNKTHPYEHVVHHWPSFRCALKKVNMRDVSIRRRPRPDGNSQTSVEQEGHWENVTRRVLRSAQGSKFSWIRHILIAAAILAFNNFLVIFVPTIRDIFGFIGSSAATMLIFILPAAFYLRLVKSLPFRSPQKISATIFLVVGIFFMISSLSLIVMDWIHNPPGSKGAH
ncbi:Sodium-coupled neutral amino acid transporter 4 [Labeo rohita]|uniref:Sodium-coupled neutral amino acid transporter 4 n=1 Tax=Labeo rohita TaxID=84645 RepID=A0ABQ8MS29_LABRO|nr:Sodium-coupled neutral amino acid transporter 4 [Labeo rohita]